MHFDGYIVILLSRLMHVLTNELWTSENLNFLCQMDDNQYLNLKYTWVIIIVIFHVLWVFHVCGLIQLIQSEGGF